MVFNNMHRFYCPISRENLPNRIFGGTARNASNVNINTIVFSLTLYLLLSPFIGGSWGSQHNFKLPRWLGSLLLLRWHKLFRFGLRMMMILVHHRLSIIVISSLVLAFALEVLLSLEILLHVLMHRRG